ncbi:MAG: glutamine--tRNA ligase-like isoform X1 [Edafosvirus sp.]|uniref:Glutamine--tRNA ligase-like isoform X1 n=1 Tax=Edafosvirus sp. TaxID=2487765 RepID=A0A3G4ZU59_9VIRU|nr:MAG: glutamine--tRNA ligase-like isoform X1 [Edafosvirus sp.]
MNQSELLKRYPNEFIEEVKKNEKIVTRFPPEPNGHLHLGHIKAMEVDFGFVEDMKKNGIDGECIMRFDDTNPSVEKQEYIDSILENVAWLNHKPSKITYTSDYFDKLYEYALILIRQGDAYVCELKSEQISEYREKGIESPYRNRKPEESLKLFEEMKRGLHDENAMTLRMKGDLSSPNPCLWDLVFYRILFKRHPRTDNKWCIYPSYDFSHCIVDSIENITHSLCTIEFETRRESYFWVLDKLNLRKPFVYEFSRLNIVNGILSKRKIVELVDTKKVSGWDDPRLLTINGLKKRGYTAESLKQFCRNTGITKNYSEIPMYKLEYCIRQELEINAPRRYVVLDPLLVKINNLELFKGTLEYTLYDFPIYMKTVLEGKSNENIADDKKKIRKIELTPEIYIDKSSFRINDSKDFYGLAPNKIIRLKCGNGPFLKCNSYKLDENNNVVEVTVDIVEPEFPKKVKGILNWVNNKALPIIIQEFDDLNMKTYVALGEESLDDCDVGTKYQFERYGYFCVDNKMENKIIFNKIVSLNSNYSG